MVNTVIMDDYPGNYHGVPTDRIARREGLHYVNVNPTEWSSEARSCLGRKDFGDYWNVESESKLENKILSGLEDTNLFCLFRNLRYVEATYIHAEEN